MAFNKFITPFATYEHVFGFEYSKEDFIEFIKHVPAKLYLCVISQLSAFPETIDNPLIRQAFTQYLKDMAGRHKGVLGDVAKKLDGHVLYPPPRIACCH